MNILRKLTRFIVIVGLLAALSWAVESCEEYPTYVQTIHEFWSLEDALKHPDDVRSLVLLLHPTNGLPDTIRVFHNLHTLIAPNCNISTVPDWFCELQWLSHINLSHNNISEFPLQVYCMKELAVIVLTGNRITRIPDSVDRFEKGICFDLDSCQLTSIPNSFIHSRFRIVRLNGNRIQALPDSLSKMKKTLEYLNLSGNPISEKEKERILRELSPEVKVVF